MASTPLPVLPPGDDAAPPRKATLPGFGERPPRGSAPGTGIASARIALVMLLVTETMFFTGLVGSYLLLRFGAVSWPPPGQPRLPLAVTWGNSGLLLASAWTMRLSGRAIRRDDRAGLTRGLLAVTALLGAIFLAVQGSEWLRLLGHGLTLQSSIYGATFYALIGCHALHVLAAVAWLGLVLVGSGRGRYTAAGHLGVDLCAMYWYFVCGLWLVLFPLVYLL